MPVGVATKLYRTKKLIEIINEIENLPDIFVGEDACINLIYTQNCSNSIAVIDNVKNYYYRAGGYSLEKNQNVLFFKKLIMFYDFRKSFIDKHCLDLNKTNLWQIIYMLDYFYGNLPVKSEEIKEVLLEFDLEINSVLGEQKDFFKNKLSNGKYKKQQESIVVRIKQFILNHL